MGTFGQLAPCSPVFPAFAQLPTSAQNTCSTLHVLNAPGAGASHPHTLQQELETAAALLKQQNPSLPTPEPFR